MTTTALLQQIVRESEAAGYPVTLYPREGHPTAILCCAALPSPVLRLIDTYTARIRQPRSEVNG